MDVLSYFSTQSPITNPGQHGETLAVMPTTAPELCTAIQGLCLDHKVWYTHNVGTERILQINSHYVETILANLLAYSKKPLNEWRDEELRTYVSSSDYVSLFCAVMRYNGIAARKRVGYKKSGDMYLSYDIAEYWDGSVWQQADPTGKLDGEFLSAAEAWQGWRKGELQAEQFRGDPSLGADVLRACLMLDLAAMNKMELLNWDRYGWMLCPLDDFSDHAWEALDKTAKLLLDADKNLEALQSIYECNEGLQVPKVIMCHSFITPPHQIELTH